MFHGIIIFLFFIGKKKTYYIMFFKKTKNYIDKKGNHLVKNGEKGTSSSGQFSTVSSTSKIFRISSLRSGLA